MIKAIFRSFILGLGVGLLLAPRSGSETRRLLSDKLNSVIDGANELGSKLDGSDSSDAAYVPQQHYAENDTSREVGSADAMTI